MDFCGKAAAIRAGYSPKWADRQATINLDHEGIMVYIDHLQKSNEAKSMAISPDWVTQRITSLILRDDIKAMEELRGLELLSKILGMLKDRTELSGPDGEAIRVQQQRIDEDAAAMEALLRRLNQKQTYIIGEPEEE